MAIEQNYNNEYIRVLAHIEHQLQATTDGRTVALNIQKWTVVSETMPSLQISPIGVPSNISTTMIYDIDLQVNPVTLTKWTTHSARCSLLIIVVPRSSVEQAQRMCTTTLLGNYEIWGYKIVDGGKEGGYTIELSK